MWRTRHRWHGTRKIWFAWDDGARDRPPKWCRMCPLSPSPTWDRLARICSTTPRRNARWAPETGKLYNFSAIVAIIKLTWTAWTGNAWAVLEQLWSLKSETLSIDVSQAISWCVQCSVCSSTAWRRSVWRRRGGSMTLAGRNDCSRSIRRVRDLIFLPSHAARSYNSSLLVHIM